MRVKGIVLIIIFLAISTNSIAKLRVVTSYPYIADVAKKIGKNRISVKSLSPGSWDPHYIVPKPSLISKVRRADILIINGAQLEIGWIPSIIRAANNPVIQPGQKGFLDLSNCVKLIEVPDSISRAQGDVHPSGNPHFILDPENVPIISEAITVKLCELDFQNSSLYKDANKKFISLWMKKLSEWSEALTSLSGVKVVEYHKNYDYLLKRYGIKLTGTIEILPGIPPTSRHIKELIEKIKNEHVKYILHDVYNPKKPARYVSEKTGIKLIILPHDVQAISNVKDIFSLFDEIVRRLTE